jgi:sulfoxide reductase catalytic subunit YedY
MASKIHKTVIPKGTRRESLVDKNPKNIDARNVAITPLSGFGTMGLEDHDIDLAQWRLIVDGAVDHTLSLTYNELLDLPSIERVVLLICPEVFVNQGKWKGVSVEALLRKAGAKSVATHVTFRGPEGNYMKTHRVPIDHALSGKSFLAYSVNGKTLPQKHGYPLRLVAEDYYGFDWIKYVYRVTVDVIKT